jgi:septum formation protein
MLKQLSGKTHKVLTGIAIAYAGEILAEVCETKVVFRQLSEDEIKQYVATGEPLDKAGAYGIQGKGAVLVEKIDGCYNNVVGLPLTRMQLILAKLGVR